MRSPKEIYKDSKLYAREFRWHSWGHLWLAVLLLVGAVGLICSPIPWLLKPLASVLVGLLIVRIFIMYHDFHHGAILKKSVVARCIFTVYGWLTLSPSSVWCGSHDHHHRHNCKGTGANPGSFRLMTCDEYIKAPPSKRLLYIASRHWLTIGLGYITVFMIGMCVVPLFNQPRRHWDGGAALVLHGLLLTSIGWWSVSYAILLIVLPLLVACGLGSYLFYAQHNFPACQLQDRKEWTHSNAALLSSSYIRMNPWMQWFTGNVGFHHVHHLNAKIPFYRLQEAMQGIAEFQTPGTTSLHPVDIVSCLRLNLWDPECGRLVSYREALARERTITVGVAQATDA